MKSDFEKETWQNHTDLAFDHLSSGSHLSSIWAWKHLSCACELFSESNSYKNAPEKIQKQLSPDRKFSGVQPDAEELWKIWERLNDFRQDERLSNRLSAQGYSKLRLFSRDIGVAFLTCVALFALFRIYNDRPANLWSDDVYTMDVNILSHKQDYGALKINETVESVPVFINGKHFPKAIGTHANSNIRVKLRKQGDWFEGGCAYPDSVNSASIVCSIIFDGREIWKTKPLNSRRRMERFRVELVDAEEFTFLVNAVGDGITAAHAVWVGLEVK